MGHRCAICEELSRDDVEGVVAENPECTCVLPHREPPHAGELQAMFARVASTPPSPDLVVWSTPPVRVDRHCESGHVICGGARDVVASCTACGGWVRLLPYREDLRSMRAFVLARREDERARACDASAERETSPGAARWWRDVAARARTNAARLRELVMVIEALDVAAEE